MNKKKNNRIEEQILIKEKNPSSTCCYTHFPAQLRKKIIIVCVKLNVNFSFPNDIIKVYLHAEKNILRSNLYCSNSSLFHLFYGVEFIVGH